MATENTASGEAITALVQAGVIIGGVTVHGGPARAPIPHNLPLGTRHFVGRRAELDRLTAFAAAESGSRLCVVDGAPGIGKTTFVVQWGEMVRDLFPDGQVYVDLRGFDLRRAPVGPGTATRMILGALHLPVRAIPPDPDGQLAFLRSTLDERRLLLIIDNVLDTDQVRPLLSGSRRCFTVVTARRRLDGLSVHHGVERVPLHPLTDEEARLLLEQHLGVRRVGVEHPAAERVVAACGGHPLALSVVAARAAADTANSLHAVVDELEDKHAALDALRLEDTADFRAVFALSYDHLPAALADAFRALTLHPGVGVDVRATAAMIGVKVHQARGTLGELVRCHLLERTSAGHYVLHALTHVFGLEQSQSHDPPEHCSSVVRALLNHQLHAASRADRLINDHRRPLPLEPCARPELLPPLADRAEALAWFTVEYDNVLATIATANAEHIHPYTWQLPWVISNYAYLTARWQDWIDTHVDAVAAAQHLGDRSAEARLLQSLARAHCESGAYRLSVKGYQAALGILDELGDVPGQANALNGIAGVRLRAGHPAEALDTGLEALGLYVSLGDDAAIAGTYSLLGRASQAVGSLTDAARYYRLAHDMYARTANHYGLAHVADCMAELELTADNHDRATEHLCRAIEMHQKVGNLTYAARSCRKLRSLLLRQGPPDARTEWLGTAITMLEKNRDVDAARILDLIAHR